jgi:hypothetical protein
MSVFFKKTSPRTSIRLSHLGITWNITLLQKSGSRITDHLQTATLISSLLWHLSWRGKCTNVTAASGTATTFWPRRRKAVAQILWPVPEAAVTVLCTADDGCDEHPKHVEWFCSKYVPAYCCILLDLINITSNSSPQEEQLKCIYHACTICKADKAPIFPHSLSG